MKIRAKLKDVIMLPDSPYKSAFEAEKREIVRLTNLVKDDPNAILKMDLSYYAGHFSVESITVVGKVPAKW